MGDFGVRTDPSTIRFERVLPGPIERVWAYLTEPEKRARWLAGGPMDLVPGGRVELRFHNSRLSGRDEPVPERWRNEDCGTIHGRILACEPPHRLAYSWGEVADGASEVTFELAEEGADVRLVLTHRRVGDGSMLLSVSSGWHTHLEFLAVELAGGSRPPFWPMLTAREQDYAARLRAM
jgi:uncharacterized protein YndB with AHSA1/START domain